MMNEKRSQELATKWLNGTITEEEKLEFAKWYNTHDDTHFYTAVENEAILKERMFNRIIENKAALDERAGGGIKINRRWQLGIAASLLICLSVMFYHSLNQGDNVVSGHKVPTLTLANGQTIELNMDQKGIVVGNDVKYLNGNRVASFNKNAVDKLILTTPKGLIYLITLPDGSKVTLNAGSTLTYPSEFSANERLVELEGEAFFEVTKVYRNATANLSAKKAKQSASLRVPFKVKTAGQTVEVLGTKFNVSAYRGDQATQTTLVEGLVRVGAGNGINKHSVILSPGQQARSAGNGISVSSVNTEPFTAWKEGYFYFENASVPMVMAQMQRWYDFDLSYESRVPDKLFFGKIPRKISLLEALKILNKAGINVRLTAENKVLIASADKKINN